MPLRNGLRFCFECLRRACGSFIFDLARRSSSPDVTGLPVSRIMGDCGKSKGRIMSGLVRVGEGGRPDGACGAGWTCIFAVMSLLPSDLSNAEGSLCLHARSRNWGMASLNQKIFERSLR